MILIYPLNVLLVHELLLNLSQVFILNLKWKQVKQYRLCVIILFPLETYKPVKYFKFYTKCHMIYYNGHCTNAWTSCWNFCLYQITTFIFLWGEGGRGVGTVNSLEHKRCPDWNIATYRGTTYTVSKKATEEWHGQSLGVFWIEVVITRDDCIKWLSCFLFLEGNPTMLKWCPALLIQLILTSFETNKSLRIRNILPENKRSTVYLNSGMLTFILTCEWWWQAKPLFKYRFETKEKLLIMFLGWEEDTERVLQG